MHFRNLTDYKRKAAHSTALQEVNDGCRTALHKESLKIHHSLEL
jgi:hypothetical protein